MSPLVHLMLGLPGSGKSTFSRKLAAQLRITRYSLDEEYFKRVPNLQQEHRNFAIEAEVVAEIRRFVIALVSRGESVVLDFCPWIKSQRLELYEFLRSHGATPAVYFLDVPEEELVRRFTARNAEKNPGHQFMTLQMLHDFYQRFDPPGEDEAVIRLSPDETVD